MPLDRLPVTPPMRARARFSSEEPMDSDAGSIMESPVSPTTPQSPLTLPHNGKKLDSNTVAKARYSSPVNLSTPSYTSGDTQHDCPTSKSKPELTTIGLVGKGGFSHTLKAEDESTGALYAVKVRDPSTDPATFERESQILTLLGHHPNIVGYCANLSTLPDKLVLELYDMDLGAYIRTELRASASPSIDELFAMARCQGTPLIGNEEFYNLGRQLVAALKHLEANRVIHGDIKPENILIKKKEGGTNRYVLADFSSAQIAVPRDDAIPAASTPVFSAPEVRYGGLTSFGSDIYSAGLVLAFCATGEEPYSSAKNMQQRLMWMDRVHPLDSYPLESQQRFKSVRPILDLFLNRAPLAEISLKLEL